MSVAEIQNLAPGDRFYFMKDKTRTVYTYIEKKFERYRYGWLAGWVKKDGDRHAVKVKTGREVVFLRHNVEVYKTL